MAETEKPYMLSFVLPASGTLLDGTPLGDAIARIDDGVSRPPEHHLINCVHAENFEMGMSTVPTDRAARVLGLEANTSKLTPEELDNREEVDTETPEDFGRQVWALRASHGARYLGGCCGSGTEHIEALAKEATSSLAA